MSDGTLNLTLPRSDKSVWDKPGLTTRLSEYDQERWMAMACGAALTMFGARRGGVMGGLLASAGAALGVRAAMGRRLKARGWRPQDIVGNASEESFPASDPPAWTPTI